MRKPFKPTHLQPLVSHSYLHVETPFELQNIHKTWDYFILIQLFYIIHTFFTVTICTSGNFWPFSDFYISVYWMVQIWILHSEKCMI